MSEKTQRKTVVKALAPLDAWSIENVVGLGTPDVNYADGWIELKVLADWPVRPDTPVRIGHYTQQQRIRAVIRTRKGGEIYMLILIEKTNEWVLLQGAVAARLVSSEHKTIQEGTQEKIREAAIAVWKGAAEMQENIVTCLSNVQTWDKENAS